MPGPRDPFLTPYMVPFGRTIAAGRYRRVVMACSAQSGKSETFLDVIGQRLDQAPAPILYVGPNKQFLTEQWEPRIMDLLDQAPSLSRKVARGKRMTKTRKMIAGVPLRLAHAGSSTALKSDPAALALTDEADELMANVKGQGNPIGLVDRRGDTYADFVHAIVSTPSEGPSDVEVDAESGLSFWRAQDPQDLSSTIWKLWQQGTMYHWAWPCPHCVTFFIPRFRDLKWPKGSTPTQARSGAFLACPADGCGGVILDEHKAAMNARGVYVAPGQRITPEGEVIGDPPDSTTASFWVSGLASPFKTFGDRAAEYVEAVRSGDQKQIQTVVNGGFGELWAPSGGESPEWAEISRKARTASYLRGQVPDEVSVLTFACDVQKMGIYWTTRGWGPRATSWLIDHGLLRGDTAEEDIWADLADLISQPVDGLPIKLAFIDSGFRPGKVETLPINRVYEFCRQFQRRVRPTKGSSSAMRTPLITSRIEVTRSGKAARFGLDLVRLDTDHWKSWVHERIRWPEDQVGAWHVPQDVEDDFCMQMVSEARVKHPSGRASWVQRSKANHYLDCEAQQAAAGHMLNVQRIPARPRPEAEPEDDLPSVPAPRPAPAAQRQQPGPVRPLAVASDPYL